MKNPNVFYGTCALLLSFGLLVISIDQLWSSFMILLSVAAMIASVLLILKGWRQNIRDAKVEQKALEASALHRSGDDELNRQIKGIKQKINFCWILMLVLLILLIAQAALEIGSFPLIIVNLLAFPLILILQGSFRGKLKKFVSGNILQSVLEEFFTNVEHSPKSYISEDLVRSSAVELPSFDRYSGDDYVKGTYKGLEFSMSDIILEREEIRRNEEEEKDESFYEVVFRGQMLICRLGRELPADVRIYPNYHGNSKGIQSPDPNFNKGFHIESKQPDRVFEVLTPGLMEKILGLVTGLGCPIHMRFEQSGRVRIALHSNRDFFEVGRGKQLDAAIMRRKFTQEAEQIICVLEIFQS